MAGGLYQRILESPIFNVIMAIRHPRIPLKYHRYEKRDDHPEVKDLETTLKTIVDQRLSVSRFGDGELRWMVGADSYSFQSASVELTKRLQAIMTTPAPQNIALCVPDVFDGLNQYVPQNKNAWMELLGENFDAWAPYLKHQSCFYDANLSRFYIDRKDKTLTGHYFDLLKRLWTGRDVLIVEGEQTRLGSGNDLLEGARSVRRVIGPGNNAFAQLQALIEAVKSYATKDTLVLLAMGPTATVLAYDLALLGYQAVDIGHADLEYEWYQLGVTQRVSIPDRHVEEVVSETSVQASQDPKYLKEIVAIVKGD